jgi:acyl-coenzyme A thioesterase PaaI-like protein
LNLLAPAIGTRMIARATVLRAGRTVTVCRGDVFAVTEGGEKLIAAMQATMMSVVDRSGVSD